MDSAKTAKLVSTLQELGWNTSTSIRPGFSVPLRMVKASQQQMDNSTAKKYLTSLIGKTLRIQISDGRMFVGQMKCTDKERNVILCNAHEYRHLQPFGSPGDESKPLQAQSRSKVTSRYVGLIVVPGDHVNKVELEEFQSNLIV